MPAESKSRSFSTRWGNHRPPEWVCGFEEAEIRLIRDVMLMIRNSTVDLKLGILSAGVAKELEEAGERRLADVQHPPSYSAEAGYIITQRDTEF